MSVQILDAKGLKCPMPIIKAKKEIDAMSPGDLLEVHVIDPNSVADFQGWSKTSKTASLKDQLTESGSDEKTVYIHVAAPAKFEAKCVTSGTHRWAVLD